MMRPSVWKGAAAGLCLLAAGCARELTTVSVRFAITPGQERFAGNPNDPQRKLASYPVSDDMDEQVYEEEMLSYVETPQVALWGGRYNGHNVTFTDSKLTPGDYTFAAWENQPEQPTNYQGWIQVNSTGDELVDMFRDWKGQMVEEKQQLAYAYEAEGNVDKADKESWKAFRRQMRTIDNIERQIGHAIHNESSRSSSIRRRNNDFMQKSVVLMFPGGDGSFYPTTHAAFTPEDMDQIKNGEAVTKLLMVSSYHDIQWKLRIIENIRRELERAKAVRYEEVQRLERRKEICQVTDHLHKNDREFMYNESRIQSALGHLDRLNDQIAQLRDKRMALAFASELTAPEGEFQPLETEQRDLQDERGLMQSDLRRTEVMLEQVAETSPLKMALERRKIWFQREIERVDSQLGSVDEARVALQTLRETSETIHRQGELRILTASLVGDAIPHRVREALEHEALMIVRLETADNLFTPKLEVARVEATAVETSDASAE